MPRGPTESTRADRARLALSKAEAAETLGVNPDTFGLDLPERQAWDRIEL